MDQGQRIYTIRGKSPLIATGKFSPYALSSANNGTNLGASSTRILRILKKYASEYVRWGNLVSSPMDDNSGFGMTIEYLTQPVTVSITGGENGTVSYSGDGLVDTETADNATDVEAYEGEDLTLTFATADGYDVIVTVDGEPVELEGDAYTLTVAQDGHAVEVTFATPTALSQISNALDGLATVYSLQGQLLLSLPASQLHSIPAGLYIVKLTNATETKTLKLKL